MASGIDEFIVARDKISEIDGMKSKIERMFGIEIGWGNVAKLENGSKQWITLSGESGDKRNAKEYVIGLCHPTVTQIMQFPTAAIEVDILESFEKQSNAVIKICSAGSGLETQELEIAGTDIAVTIALSLLETLLEEQNKQGDTSNHSSYSCESLASQRLQDGLQRALSQHSDGGCCVDDYSLAPDSVKRVILQCLRNESLELTDENDLFGAKTYEGTSLQHAEPEGERLELYGRGQTFQDMVETDGVFQETHMPYKKNVDTITQQLTVANLSTSNSDTGKKKINVDDSNFLVKYGRSVGYSEREITEAMNFVDEKTSPSDFLELLTTIKSQLEEEDMKEKNKTVDPVVKQRACGASSSPLYNRLPEEYREKLLQDMVEEGDHSSLEDLKRRNQERQNSLRRAFKDNPTSQKKEKLKIIDVPETEICGDEYVNSFDSPVHVDERTNGLAHKERYESPSPKFNTKHKHSDSKPPKRSKKGKMSTKSTPLSFAVNEKEHIQDEDQTCVMKLWTPEKSDCCVPHIETPKTEMMYSRQPLKQQPRTPYTAPIVTRAQSVDERVPRYIVIDGSNVAMAHGNDKAFSCKGLKICVDYFLQRGHTKITVFVPVWRSYKPKPDRPITDQYILEELKEQGYLVFTPGRRLGNRKIIACYDDRFVLDLAEKEDGIIVSLDQYRDLIQERKCWQRIVDERLLMYCFVGDNFMPPDDPLGRDGPSLTNFLLKSPDKSSPCHNRQPDIGIHNRGYSSEYRERQSGPVNMPLRILDRDVTDSPRTSQNKNWQQNKKNKKPNLPKKTILRTQKSTENLFSDLQKIFSEDKQKEIVRIILENHPEERDINRLTNYCMSVLFN